MQQDLKDLNVLITSLNVESLDSKSLNINEVLLFVESWYKKWDVRSADR